jgi:hypothetical protein
METSTVPPCDKHLNLKRVSKIMVSRGASEEDTQETDGEVHDWFSKQTVELCEKSVQNLMSQSHKFIGKMLDFV